MLPEHGRAGCLPQLQGWHQQLQELPPTRSQRLIAIFRNQFLSSIDIRHHSAQERRESSTPRSQSIASGLRPTTIQKQGSLVCLGEIEVDGFGGALHDLQYTIIFFHSLN